MSAKRTAWHFYFCILLRRYGPPSFEIRDEVPLSKEPPRMDYLILRRTAEPSPADTGQTLRGLWPLLPRVAIAELKTIGRPYQKANLDRLWSYAHAYHADEHRSLNGRGDLCAVLIVPCRTRTLDADAKAAGLVWVDKSGGYWQLTGGLFTLYVVELDVVAEREDEDLLALYSHSEVRTPRAVSFWGELVGPEAKMNVRELEGYDEAIQRILSAMPPELRLAGLAPELRLAGLAPELRLAGLAPEQRLAGLAPEQRLAGLAPEQRLAGLAPEQRLAGLAPEQRLAGLAPEQALLALPDDMLRRLPEDFLATLSEATRVAIRQRVGR